MERSDRNYCGLLKADQTTAMLGIVTLVVGGPDSCGGAERIL